MTSIVTQNSPSVLQPSPVILDSVPRSSSQRSSIDEGDTSSLATPRNRRGGRQQSIDDLRLLAISAQITEVSYSIGELQTRIFEIQELRHRSIDPATSSPQEGRKSSDSTSSSTSVIDNALGQLDVRLDSVSQTIASITLGLEPLASTTKTPTEPRIDTESEASIVLHKYGDLMDEWHGVQTEARVLREELKEDKWLAVFRTVSEQADGMMTSLDKAVNLCQDFIGQVYNQTKDHRGQRPSSNISERSFTSLASFDELIKSYEAKKKYYVPSTSKVIIVLSKGIDDRVTKNGECLRKYADMKTRWDALKVKIKRVDHELEKVKKILIEIERESEAGSVVSETSFNYATPPSRGSRAASTSSTSTLARLAAKVSTVVGRSPASSKHTSHQLELPEQPQRTIGRRTSFLPFRTPQEESFQITRPKLFQSASAATAPSTSVPDDWVDLGNGRTTVKATKPRWNISTKPDSSSAPPLPPVPGSYRPPSAAGNRPRLSRPPSSTGRYGPGTKPPTTGPPPIPTRSSARPHTPVRIVSNGNLIDVSSPPTRPGSRAQSALGMSATPRARPKTPSMIPAPRFNFSGSASQASDDWPENSLTPFSQRVWSPDPGASPSVLGGTTPSRRRPSASHIPIPTFGPRSRATSPSPFRPLSPNSSAPHSANSSLIRSQTPDHSPQSQSRFHHGTSASTSILPSMSGRQTLKVSANRGPPSSFRDGSTPPTRNPSSVRSPSRSGSRAEGYFPPQDATQGPMYMPSSVHDPLDNEVAQIVNSIPHGLKVERLDPPLRSPPHPGEEVKAQYALSNNLSRRVLGFRLVIINRQGTETRKVMARVGGGWVDLSTYMTNRYSI